MSRSRRHSHSRVARRRARFAAVAPTLAPCPRCKTPKQPHRVCPSCGTYDGRQVVPVGNDKQPRHRRAST
ncbi:MAG: 50S ribosomal protein L32 [Armatimonadota bacterium]|nr:50S ribosomal protein L32 [Armatimonadota bacterium]MDR5697463.1 50S ribosomal protein L32 [Armatimonadota bacterium]